MEYTFTLKYRLSESDCDHEESIGRQAAAGCDDALIGIGQPGRIALAFTREADSAEAALMSALKDVKSAIPTATLVEASPDFVGLTDVADTIGDVRQADKIRRCLHERGRWNGRLHVFQRTHQRGFRAVRFARKCQRD